jgi:hypothetical protein
MKQRHSTSTIYVNHNEIVIDLLLYSKHSQQQQYDTITFIVLITDLQDCLLLCETEDGTLCC